MADIVTFGSWLKRCRLERGLTQDDLAERVGCATQTIRKIENGQRRPSFQMAERLAQMLAIAPDSLDTWMRTARDLDTDELATPEAATPATAPVRVPTYLTPFVGREREVAELRALLAAPETRLVTLLGPGGIGKTRLAVEVCTPLTNFPDGAIFVSLAAVALPDAIVPAIGDALAYSFSGTTNLIDQLVRHLRDTRTLLILDNLEHLLDAQGTLQALLDGLLTRVPGLTVLTTSRERLRLAGEWIVEVDGLALPDDARQLDANPALELFAQHAQRVQRGFELTPRNRADVAAICRLVGGMPLGIELAAAWVRHLSPAEIGEELARNLDAQHLSPGSVPPRHRSLRAVVEHSWQLLPERERRILQRLAVFQGGFDRTAALAVAGADLPTLAALTDKSLLRRTSAGRYDVHDVIRQFAAQYLEADPAECAGTHDRHADYFAGWLAARETAVKGAQAPQALAEISADIDNVRAMWRWDVQYGRLANLCRATETLQWFFEFRSWYSEGAALLNDAITAVEQSATAGTQTLLGRLLGHWSYLASRIGALEQGRAAAARSCALLEQNGDTAARARALVYHGMLAFQTGAYDEACALLATGRRTADPGDTWTLALCDTWSCLLFHALGEYEQAEVFFRAALARYRVLGNPRSLVFCLTFCSPTLVARGNAHEAQVLLRESFMLASAAADRFGMAIALQHLGVVALEQQQPDEAVYLFHEAVGLMRTIGSRWDLARALNQFGAAQWAAGKLTDAGATYREALATALEAQAIPDALQALAGMAAYAAQSGRYADALALATRILRDRSARTETQAQAEQVRRQTYARLAAEDARAIEHATATMPLAELARSAA